MYKGSDIKESPIVAHTTEGQNACCWSLERAGWVYDGDRSGEMEDRLKKKPIFVYTKTEKQLKKTIVRRAIVGDAYMTVYVVDSSKHIEPMSYRVEDYIKSGEIVNG